MVAGATKPPDTAVLETDPDPGAETANLIAAIDADASSQVCDLLVGIFKGLGTDRRIPLERVTSLVVKRPSRQDSE